MGNRCSEAITRNNYLLSSPIKIIRGKSDAPVKKLFDLRRSVDATKRRRIMWGRL